MKSTGEKVRQLNIGVLEGGCLGRGLFDFHTLNHENHGPTR